MHSRLLLRVYAQFQVEAYFRRKGLCTILCTAIRIFPRQTALFRIWTLSKKRPRFKPWPLYIRGECGLLLLPSIRCCKCFFGACDTLFSPLLRYATSSEEFV